MICTLPHSQAADCRDDDPWDVFIADDDERDPQPEPGDFWSDEPPAVADARHRSAAFGRREATPCYR